MMDRILGKMEALETFPSMSVLVTMIVNDSAQFLAIVQPLKEMGFSYQRLINTVPHTDEERRRYRECDQLSGTGGKRQKGLHQSNPSGHPKPGLFCDRCGRSGHPASECHNKNPDVNEDWAATPFAHSQKGKQWIKRGIETVPPHLRLDGTIIPGITKPLPETQLMLQKQLKA